MAYDILIIDDEADIRELISDVLKDEGYGTRAVSDSVDAFAAMNTKIPSLVILDIWLQGSELDGLGILEIIKKKYPNLPVIIISGHGTIETAVTAIKMGAYDYIEKPFSTDKLLIMTKRACEAAKLRHENAVLKSKIKEDLSLIGNSSALVALKSSIEKVAVTSSRVLITGPYGSGKGLVAKLIWKKSKNKNRGPFVFFSPTGIDEIKIDAEIFGTEAGIGINGAPRRQGLLEKAHLGTLFIDEVADLPMSVQTKLLRFLQDQTFEMPGIKKSEKIEVRLIVSSSVDLLAKIKEGKFRQDLYYRLNVVPLKVPSLSERKDDIQPLIEFIMKQLNETESFPLRKLTDEAIAAMQAYKWPGNVRQLRNVIEWILIMNQTNSSEPVSAEMLPPDIMSKAKNGAQPTSSKVQTSSEIMSMPLREAREMFEREYLSVQMTKFNNNISRTSCFVGMERSALHRKLKSLNIHSTGNVNEENVEEMVET